MSELPDSFQHAYDSARSAIARGDKDDASKAYHDLLASYQTLSGVTKQDAYSKVAGIHADVNGMPDEKSYGLHAKDYVILGTFFILIAVVLFGNAGTLGFTVEDGAPVWNGVRAFSGTAGVPFILDLSTAFRDPDGDALAFMVSGASGIDVSLHGSVITILPRAQGTYVITLMASDSIHLTKVPITVQV
ncbi:MAG TPA: hypothetical protein VLJ21_03770 [Candidatus Binatia bacterium]|nr:hypothetical protein [Candidatus Binatia bacterium]